jgi:hypothetical protein
VENEKEISSISSFFLPNKLLLTCNMYIQNKIIENIYFKYFKTESKVISVLCYSDNTMLHFVLSHNALSQHSIDIVSKRYRSWYKGALIAS